MEKKLVIEKKWNKPAWILIAFVVVFALFSMYGQEDSAAPAAPVASTAPPPIAATPTPVVRPPAADARLEECRAKLKAAIPLDLITNMSFDEGRPKLWVGPTWQKITIDAKEGLAREAACFFLAGNETQAITFPIFDGMTGKQIATWKYTKLEVE